MKIRVEDIKPNPFRRIPSYPINKEKIESLKISIKDTSFWDNILVRPDGDGYELAYGHHRLLALKELGIKEIDIPVRELDNCSMLKIMANENLEWSSSPAVMNETVLATKEFLDAELAKYESWEDLSDKNIRQIFYDRKKKDGTPIKPEHAFVNTKTKGVGRDTILKFLGGNWKSWMIQTALEILSDKDIDRKAAEQFPTMGQARAFKGSVKKHGISKDKQKDLAKSLKGTGKRDIDRKVAESKLGTGKKKPEPKKEPEEKPVFEVWIKELSKEMYDVYNKLGKTEKYLGHLDPKSILYGEFYVNARLLKDLLSDILQQKKGGNNNGQ